MATHAQPHWTVEAYLQHERDTRTRHEYIDGQLYAMSGGNDAHSLIKVSLTVALVTQLRQSPCRVYDSDMRVKISDSKYVYPDLSVVCGQATFADENRTMLTNPALVVEVLSDSTAGYDMGIKANFYRSLPSLQAYLILHQDTAHAQLYTRHEAGWLLRDFLGMQATVPLEALSCDLALSAVYGEIWANSDES